jgi:hypothetical protein
LPGLAGEEGLALSLPTDLDHSNDQKIRETGLIIRLAN